MRIFVGWGDGVRSSVPSTQLSHKNGLFQKLIDLSMTLFGKFI